MWKAFPKNHAMIYAFHQMNHRIDQKKITAKIYEVLRYQFVEIHSKMMKRKESH